MRPAQAGQGIIKDGRPEFGALDWRIGWPEM
jgi:hypothetical protein